MMAVIEGAGHMPNMEKPAEFNRVLAEFLETLNGAAGVTA